MKNKRGIYFIAAWACLAAAVFFNIMGSAVVRSAPVSYAGMIMGACSAFLFSRHITKGR
ncbi:MAG: hypothetical protein FWH06_05840 [Oscillospiraceae bacterium]|nr:hypothetical protein [Oscillospiraceae bacterium]